MSISKQNQLQSMFSKGSVAVCALALTVMVSACNGGNVLGPNPNAKVATVDSNMITRGEYDKTYKLISKNMNVDLDNVADPNQKQMMTQALTQMTLNKLIVDALVENEAKSLGLTVTEADVTKFKDSMFTKNPKAKEEFKKYLDDNMMSEKDFDESLKQNLLTEKLIEKKAGDKIAVTDVEVSSFYKGHPEQFKMPEQIRASHILVKAIVPQMARDMKAQSPGKPESEIKGQVEAEKAKLKAKAEKIFTEVQSNPKKFEDLAKRESNDPGSAARGGDLDYMTQANLDPAFWAALKQTKVGQLHPSVVETQFGYHIVKVTGEKPPKTNTLVEMKPMIHDFLAAQKKQQVLMQWASEKRALAKIDIAPEYQPKQPAAGEQKPGEVNLGGGAPMSAEPPKQQ